MASGQLQPVLRQLRQIVDGKHFDNLSDQALLDRFAAHHEEAVFEALLRRHGPLVLGVCRRTLGHEQDAEDVFQATFLVLARKASSIRKQASLGSWLHGVAYRLALKARAAAARRRGHERRCGAMSALEVSPDAAWREMRPLIDEELERLPWKHRAPLILCYLEGKTHAEAAQALGWSLGSMSKRLARARELLRGRLERRGIALSAALAALTTAEARAAVPAILFETSLKAALLAATGQSAVGVVSPAVLNLMGGGLRTMLYTKLCRVGTLILAGLLLTGGLGFAVQQFAATTEQADQDRSVNAVDDQDNQTRATADLAFVPSHAVGFLHIAVHDLWTMPALKSLRAQSTSDELAFLKDFSKEIGVGLGDVQAVTFIVLEGPQRAGRADLAEITAVTTVQPYAKDRVIRTLIGEAQNKEDDGKTYFTAPGNGGKAVYAVNEHTFIVGSTPDVRLYLAALQAGSKGPLARGLMQANQKHTALAAFHLTAALAGEIQRRPPTDPLRFLQPAVKVEAGMVIVDLSGQEMRVDARLRYSDEDTAEEARDAMKVGLNMLRQSLTSGIPADAQAIPSIAGIVKEANRLLRATRLESKGTEVDIRVESKSVPVLATLLPALQRVRKASARMSDANNLKQMALAMHNYADANNHFPAHAVFSKDGKPLLSWRVAILPYIEQSNLYNQFHLDEPWDSEHNKKLVAQMPVIYKPVIGQAGAGETFYQVLVGNDTVFPRHRASRFSDITDGTSNTIMITEGARAVPWTKPEDLLYSADKPLPQFGGQFKDGFQAAFADGSVHWIAKNIDQKLLRALITANGGEVVTPP